ncbi:MAG: efflux RND transporter permease subunit [Candidatus Hinthialibacter antarcticus]|nr:efflux RND transporter permease subunit [Candidatus Hinthialibacter antarcticus]
MSRIASSFTALGVRRPVLAVVMSLLIILAGISSFLGVDVRELPDVDTPTVSVRATFEGASPETMDTEVTSILEGAVARVQGVKSIRASSEENYCRIFIEFQPHIDIDVASNDVREAINRRMRDLPDDVEDFFIMKGVFNDDSVCELSVYSDVLSKEELAKRVEKDISPHFLSIPGVADVEMSGDQQRVLRVLLDPARMAGLRVAVNEVISCLRNARLDVPAGSYQSEDQELIIRAEATVIQPKRVEELYIRDDVRIGDIGVVFFGPEEAEDYSMLNGRVVIGMGIIRQSGANTITISQAVDEKVAEINQRVNEFHLVKTSDNAIFIKGALKEVLFSLGFSILIVLIVIGVFLGRWRTTLIPAVTIPVSLIGTVAAIWLLGFSINLLTLLALVLATGLIVDDAIVVLENIQRRRHLGLDKMAAAVVGTHQVFFAVVATTLTLVSVFLPISFLPSRTGILFREFGLVLAVAVCISSFVALTLCPMMASRLPDSSKKGFIMSGILNLLAMIGEGLSSLYFQSLRLFLRHKYLALIFVVILAGYGATFFLKIKQELLPQEDRGMVVIMATGPDGASLNYSDRQAEKIEEILYPYQQSGLIKDIYTTVGRYDKNRTLTIATLKHWDERSITQQEFETEINKQLIQIPGVQISIRRGNSLGIRGAGSGISIALTGNDYNEILQVTEKLKSELEKRIPVIDEIQISFDTSQPELSFNINRNRVSDLNISLESISQTLRVMVDRYDVTDLNIDDEAIPIMLGSIQGVADDPGDLLNTFILNRNQELVPLTTLVDIKEAGVAAQLDRHAQRRAIEMNISFPPGNSLGELVNQVREIANEVLPLDIGLLFRGEAETLNENNYEVAATFLIALLVIFLVLAAQFESMGSALIVIFTVPFGLAAAAFALSMSNQTLNVYSQIGFVMLIGLMTKNAILLVEFMDQLREEGRSVDDAIMEGIEVRLRPLTMTVLSTVLGSLPLILSEGPGAEARSAIGWVVFGGLGLSSLFTLYLTPLGYLLIAPWMKPRSHAVQQLEMELRNADPSDITEEALPS